MRLLGSYLLTVNLFFIGISNGRELIIQTLNSQKSQKPVGENNTLAELTKILVQKQSELTIYLKTGKAIQETERGDFCVFSLSKVKVVNEEGSGIFRFEPKSRDN